MQVNDDINLGHVCGTAGKVFYLEMDVKVRRFHDREVVPGYLRESPSLRCVSVDVYFMDFLAEKSRMAQPAFLGFAVLLGISAAVFIFQCPG